jgi:hypothetical protein
MCLEEALMRVFGAVFDLRLPDQACLVMTIGAQAAWWLFLPASLWWLAPACLAAALLWGLVCWPLAQARCGLACGLLGMVKTLLQATGMPVPSRPLVLVCSLPLLAALGAPWWPASVLWLILVILFLFYGRGGLRGQDEDHEKREPGGGRLIFGLELALLALGAGIVVLVLSVEQPGRWLDGGSAALLLSSLGLLIFSGLNQERPIRGLINRLAWVGPALLPFFLIALPPGSEPSRQNLILVLAVGLGLWPGALWTAALLRHRLSLARCHALLARWEVPQLVGRNASHPLEDAIRQSDGYCRVCHPHFRHLVPEKTGETGYLTWIGGEERIIDSECVVFRTTTLADSNLLTTQDPRGRSLARLVQELLPDIGLDAVQPLRQAFLEGWVVRRLRPRQIPLAKMPWDHPFLLVVPINAHLPFRYPAGSGIHDRDGYPCEVAKADVHIALRPEVLEAVERVSTARPGEPPTPQDVRLLRLLLWNCWRILPACYELLLTCLVRRFRKESVVLFAEHEPGGQVRTGKADFMRALERDWNESLGEPLASLIQVSVSDLEVDTSFASGVRNRLFELRQREKDQPFRHKRVLDLVLRRIESLVIHGKFGDRFEEAEPPDVELLSQGVDQARCEITQAASKAIQDVSKFQKPVVKPGGMPEGVGALASAFATLSDTLEKTHSQFEAEINRRFDGIDRSLRRIQEVTASARHEQS